MPALLAQVITEMKDRIQSAQGISLFLDFDGTLVPITEDPMAPQLDPDAAETLKSIAVQEGVTTTIISGRAIEDLYSRIRLDSLIYAGNYGLEIFGRGLRFVEPAAWSRREHLAELCEKLSEDLRPIDGVLVEHKGLTASIHYRQVAANDVPKVQAAVREGVARNGALFRLIPGRKVLEIVPRTDWHKGAAVRWINNHLEGPLLSIYLGDDASDEEAFSVMPDAITVKVGNAPVTCARYHLPDPAAVHELLLWLSTQETSRLRRV
ncbi:Trehalose-phosphatase [Candidatus Sulfopaludibacter sp. SbA3]|nr:Trehalose-phosphatase [Candidatus Sulfopaludibacter sp. SbA3]